MSCLSRDEDQDQQDKIVVCIIVYFQIIPSACLGCRYCQNLFQVFRLNDSTIWWSVLVLSLQTIPSSFVHKYVVNGAYFSPLLVKNPARRTRASLLPNGGTSEQDCPSGRVFNLCTGLLLRVETCGEKEVIGIRWRFCFTSTTAMNSFGKFRPLPVASLNQPNGCDSHRTRFVWIVSGNFFTSKTSGFITDPARRTGQYGLPA